MPGEPILKQAAQKSALSRFARFRIGLGLAWNSVKNFFTRLFRYFFPLKGVKPIKAQVNRAPTHVKSVVPPPEEIVYTHIITPNPKPPAPPFWWTLSNEAYQKKCNEAVQNAVKQGLKGYDFAISTEDQLRYQQVYTTLLEERNKLRSAYGEGDSRYQAADQKFRNLPSLDSLQNKHILAFNQAIKQYGQDYDFRVNGLCLKNIKNVRGTNNNCGANALFHILLENLETLSPKNEQDKSLLESLRTKLVEEQNKESKNLLNILKEVLGQNTKKQALIESDAHSIKQYIVENYPGHERQDELFGPVIRRHLAKILFENKAYRQHWVDTILLSIDENWDSKTIKEPTYSQYLSNREVGGPINPAYTNPLFESYYKRLADPENSIMLTVAEIAQYASIMKFDLNIYALRADGLYHAYANPSDAERERDRLLVPRKFSANIINVGACHWQYDVTPSHYPENQVTRTSRPSM